jgi:hypothetical protein
MGQLLALFILLVNFFANLPASHIVAPSISPFALAAYYMVLLTVLLLPVFEKKLKILFFSLSAALAVFVTGLFVPNGKGANVLYGRYNLSVLFQEGGLLKAIGGGIDGKILKNAVLASGRKQIDCLFLNSASKSAAFALKDLAPVKVKNIYLPYGKADKETKELLNKYSFAKITFLKSGDEECSVKAGRKYLSAITYKTGGIASAGNMETIYLGNEVYSLE